ncbi:hypothetical protein MKX33_00760 [Paenibacillus sp. FSL R5-0490]|uniref:hypothetical protein n=1 Tax=Paenibacillus sp. FSL R5-0490 TaxID=1920424 RepID=UPI0030CD99AE
MTNIEILNSLEVTEWSASSGVLEYLYVLKTPETVEKLLQLGMSQADIDHNTDNEENEVNIGNHAFVLTDANWYDGEKFSKRD